MLPNATSIHDSVLFECIFNSSPDTLSVFDQEGNLIRANRTMPGLTFDQVKGQGWKKVVDPETVIRCLQWMTEALKTGQSVQGEIQTIFENGQVYYFRTTVNLMQLPTGEQQFLLTTTDISEQRHLHQEAITQRTHFQTVFENSERTLYIFDKELNLLHANRCPKDTGVRDLRGKGWVSRLDAYVAKALEKQLPIAIQKGDKLIFDLDLDFQEEPSFFEVAITPYLSAGEQRLLVGFNDVTEQRKRERKLCEQQKFIDGINSMAPALLYVYDVKKQSNVFSNRELSRVLGYSSQEAKEWEQGILSLIHAEDTLSVFQQQMRTQAADDDQVNYVEYRIRHKEGKWVWMASWDKPFRRDAQGKVVEYIGMAQDITELKSSQDALERALRESKLQRQALQHSNEELEQFAYVASHDLQEPVRIISQYLQLMNMDEDNQLSPGGQRYMRKALQASHRMRALITGLLDFSRMGNRKLEMEHFSGNTLIAGIKDEFAERLEVSAVRMDLDSIPQLEGDKVLLEQLLSNLVSNAIKFRNTGKDSWVKIAYTDTPDNHIISVKDNGIGIEPEGQEEVFQIFSRLHTTCQYTGHGIGLTLARRIAERHGGKLNLQSNLGRGTAVTLELPKQPLSYQPTQP